MNTYIGIDLGTSGLKMLLVAADGKILAENTQTYPVFYPKPGWSEQNPEDWYDAALRGLKALLEGQDRAAVKGISFGGQMHGLVILDEKDEVIRPAILWNEVFERSIREGQAFRIHGQHRLRRLHRAQAPLDEKA